MFFKDLPQNPNFPELENDILKWWYQNDIISQYLHKNDKSDKNFSFIDGPITANGPMGVHHARGRTLKDVFQRFKNACGYRQRFQNGFDCQGLWVEVEVEKDNGFNSKKDIQKFGLAKFTHACLDRVDKFSQIQTDQSKRLGMFMNWDNSYYTNSKENNLYIWHFLKIVHQKGWLTQKKSATTWCPRCETGLSQHEQADGYKDITDTSVYLSFKLKNRDNEYVLAWTTTPWTLSANVLLAINTKHQYVKAKDGNRYLYLAKSAADRLNLTNYQPIDPHTLLNLEYESLYDIPAQKNIRHYLTDWDLVDPIEGTGVVHIAPGCGQEDFELGITLKADMIAPLDERGYFIKGFGDLTGKYAHDVGPQVIDYLKSINSLFKTDAVTHRYPHCWRCHTKCLFRLEDNWYMNCDTIRPRLKAAVDKVNFHPKFGLRRMHNWLDSMGDWMISRKRFYGLALPFYPCTCGHLTVIGSLEELTKLALKPELVDTLKSLHRPWIDEIEIKCPKCGRAVKRIPDVGDVWLDAGIVPFSTLKYLTDKNYWQTWFPAELVLEMTEQIRLWFYSMLFMSVTFENTAPYQHVVTYAEVRDENGDRMSKTKKNGIPYDQAVEKMGADSMRWLYCQQKAYTNVSFGYNIADRVKRDFILILWNSYRFFTQHANLENWQPQPLSSVENVLDKWILSRLHHTIASVTKHTKTFNTSLATKKIEQFINDLSTWYIRRSRERTDNFAVLYHCFETLSRLLAPFIPFVSEIIYQNLHGYDLGASDITVHSQNWPKIESIYTDTSIETKMDKVREFCQQIHALRQQSGIKIRQPLASATVTEKLPKEFLGVIKNETNVKSINIGNSVSLDINLTPDLIAEGEYRDLVRTVQVLRKQANLKLTDRIHIIAPSWPEKYRSEILKKTLAVSIAPGDKLTIEKT